MMNCARLGDDGHTFKRLGDKILPFSYLRHITLIPTSLLVNINDSAPPEVPT